GGMRRVFGIVVVLCGLLRGCTSGGSDEAVRSAAVTQELAHCPKKKCTNSAPVVHAGPDQAVTLGMLATLNGTAADDGLPTGSILSIAWSKVSGPGVVTFANPNAAATTAAFSVAGTYVLR